MSYLLKDKLTGSLIDADDAADLRIKLYELFVIPGVVDDILELVRRIQSGEPYGEIERLLDVEVS